MEIKLSSNLRDYKIIIENNLIENVCKYVKSLNPKKVFIVTDTNVYPLYYHVIESQLLKSGFLVYKYILEAGEKSKSYENLIRLYEECANVNITRSDMVIALGGGVVGDIAGFLAGTYLRGVKLIQIPTTLLAQIDSSVGGKTAINLSVGKNLAGIFYQPFCVLIDPMVLDTLPKKDFSDGISEAIKYGILYGKKMLSLMESFEETKKNILQIIELSVKIKRDIVVKDEFDTNERLVLNLGHTVGHTIEKAGEYSRYTHGEAVALGIISACEISNLMNIMNIDEVNAVRKIIQNNNLPVKTHFSAEDCLKWAVNDKKTIDGFLNFILPKKIGLCEILKMDFSDFESYAQRTSIFEKK